jgi:hypothetical protein
MNRFEKLREKKLIKKSFVADLKEFVDLGIDIKPLETYFKKTNVTLVIYCCKNYKLSDSEEITVYVALDPRGAPVATSHPDLPPVEWTHELFV